MQEPAAAAGRRRNSQARTPALRLWNFEAKEIHDRHEFFSAHRPRPARRHQRGAASGFFQEAPKALIYIRDWRVLAIWGMVLLALVVGLYFIWRWWRKKVEIPPAPLPAHVRARRKLDQALALISDPKAFSTAVSGAIREYLEERFDFHAPDRTTEEFLYELQGSMLLTRDQKASLVDFLASCDLIKFARYEPTEVELRDLHQSALQLVNETEPLVVPGHPPVVPPPSLEPQSVAPETPSTAP